MSHELIPYSTTAIEIIGQTANQYAAMNVFTNYQEKLAGQTARRQKADITLFSAYLGHATILLSPDELLHTPESWRWVTHGLVDGFVRWMLAEGYAIGSINVRLSTIRTYCQLATRAGVMATDTHNHIKLVTGYRHREGVNLDKGRDQARRSGSKKADPVSITFEQAQQLKAQPDTMQGRRDALLMCLLLDHGLRCGEIAALSVSSLNTTRGTLTFYREKVDKNQTHELTRDTLIAAIKYLEICTPGTHLLMGSRKGGQLLGSMSSRAITDRVKTLCQKVGIAGASAHDGRHAWATFAIRGGTDLKSLQDAGGWNSIAMPARYAASHQIANKGVILGK